MDFSHHDLIPLVKHHRPDLNGQISLRPVPTGKFNTSFFVDADGEGMILRIAPPDQSVFCFYERDMMRQEPGLHSLLREQTSVPVPRIIAYDNSRELIDRDFLLMERLPGRPLTETARVNQADVLRQVGKLLAETHALTAETYGYIGEHRPMEPRPCWREAFRTMWHKLIDDVESVGHYNGEESGYMRGLLEGRLSLFDRDVPSRLLHMDVWAQNILVDGSGKVTGLIDWDRALWGDREIEFAVLDYCGISEPPFWEGYGEQRDTSREARVRQGFYLLYELQKYIVIREGRGNDTASARRYKSQVMQLARGSLG